MGFIEKDNKTYAIITADGALRIATTEHDPDAEKRVIEKTDGTTVVKYELVKKGYKGIIEMIEFKEADWGKMINVYFKKESLSSNQVILSLNTGNNFATDFMRKLPNVDIKQEISISPFSFTGEKGKLIKGITIWQGEENEKVKIEDFFRDKEKKKNLNGMPSPKGDGKGFDKDDWIMYFTEVKKFLVKFTEKNIIPTLSVALIEEIATDEDKD